MYRSYTEPSNCDLQLSRKMVTTSFHNRYHLVANSTDEVSWDLANFQMSRGKKLWYNWNSCDNIRDFTTLILKWWEQSYPNDEVKVIGSESIAEKVFFAK